jgi:hypothetical protein
VPRTIGQLPHIKSTWLGVQPTITRPTDPINIMYYVVRMLSDGSLKCINATHDKEYANDLCDFYSEDYPHAYVDILTSEDVDELQLQEKS